MKATHLLHNLGQSIWLDNITRDLLNTGMLQRHIDDFSVTGLTSNQPKPGHDSPTNTLIRRYWNFTEAL